MNKKLFLLLAIVIASVLVNSCKKESQGRVESLFSGGYWQLASLTATNYTGNSQNSIDTLNLDANGNECGLSERFTFNTDHTCTYSNYNCDSTQATAHGTWAMAQNQLFFSSDLSFKVDTGIVKPFANCKIDNLGQYSLVIETGDIAPNYSLTQKRTVYTWGFIRQTQASGN